jgi:hypothetical protein
MTTRSDEVDIRRRLEAQRDRLVQSLNGFQATDRYETAVGESS